MVGTSVVSMSPFSDSMSVFLDVKLRFGLMSIFFPIKVRFGANFFKAFLRIRLIDIESTVAIIDSSLVGTWMRGPRREARHCKPKSVRRC